MKLMRNKKVAIVGSSGFIGSKLIDNLIKCKNVEIMKISSSDKNNLMLNLEKPSDFDYSNLHDVEFILFTAAISSPDYCANKYEKAYKVNVIGTKYFINEALKRKCKVLFFSSDAVYGKDNGIPNNELSETKANTPYGLMKKEIEDNFKNNLLFKAIRLSYVIASNDKFINYLKKCLENDIIAEIIHPFYRNCITLNEVIESVIWLISNWDYFNSPFLNICGNDLISRVAIVDEFNRFSKIKVKYKIVYPDENFFRNRPQITEMSSLYLDKILKNIRKPFSMRLKSQLFNT